MEMQVLETKHVIKRKQEYSCNKITTIQIQISAKIEMAFSQILAIR